MFTMNAFYLLTRDIEVNISRANRNAIPMILLRFDREV